MVCNTTFNNISVISWLFNKSCFLLIMSVLTLWCKHSSKTIASYYVVSEWEYYDIIDHFTMTELSLIHMSNNASYSSVEYFKYLQLLLVVCTFTKFTWTKAICIFAIKWNSSSYFNLLLWNKEAHLNQTWLGWSPIKTILIVLWIISRDRI